MKFLQKSLAFFARTEYDYRDGQGELEALSAGGCSVDQQTG